MRPTRRPISPSTRARTFPASWSPGGQGLADETLATRFPILARRPLSLALGCLALTIPVRGAESDGHKPLPRFDRVVIDDAFPGAYQVEVADVDGDGRLDMVALGGGTCAWYQNPTWTKRIITGPDRTPGVISSATRDLDGDGKAEVAIAYEFEMNEPTRGKLLLASQGETIDDPWTVKHVADVPSIHRLRWLGAVGPDASRPPGSPNPSRLVVAPLFGRSARPPIFDQEPARVLLFDSHKAISKPRPTGDGAFGGGVGGIRRNGGGGVGGFGGGGGTGRGPDIKPMYEWKSDFHFHAEAGKSPVLHAIDVVDVTGDTDPDLLWASNDGVTLYTVIANIGGPIYGAVALVQGAPGEAPKKGASEIHLGRLGDGRRFLTTVEPWHGTDVAIYLAESGRDYPKFGPRTVIDATLKEGHALWVADVDGDGDDEVFAGYRGPGASINAYDFDGTTWIRTVLDPAIAAQDLRGGDLDGDGTPDVVAVGGKTHNVVWYRPIREPVAP